MFWFLLTNLFGRHSTIERHTMHRNPLFRTKTGKHIAQINLFSFFFGLFRKKFSIHIRMYFIKIETRYAVNKDFWLIVYFKTTDEHVVDDDKIGLNPQPNAHTIQIINRHTKIKINNKRWIVSIDELEVIYTSHCMNGKIILKTHKKLNPFSKKKSHRTHWQWMVRDVVCVNWCDWSFVTISDFYIAGRTDEVIFHSQEGGIRETQIRKGVLMF